MNTILAIGAGIVIFALIFYTIGIYTEQRNQIITKKVLVFLSLGLLFDVTATACMLVGSSNSPFTFHGFIGYAALLAMSIETILAFQFYNKYGANISVSKNLHLYSRFAYILWILVFITGSLMVSLK